MKFVVVIAVVAFVLWLMSRRHAPPPPAARRGPAPGPVPMLRCARCGLHLPQSEAAFDAVGRPYCSAAHRVAGPA